MAKPTLLLDAHLKALRLPTFLREYDKVARHCAQEGLDCSRYLFRLCELELLDRAKRWTPSTGQLINVAKWNLLRYLPVKMRGAEDDQEKTAQSFASV